MLDLTAKFILVTLLIAAAGISAASAQVNGSAIRANIPYDFVLQDKTFPAGKYTIQRTDSTIDPPSLLVLRGEDSSAIFDTMTATSNRPAKSTQLVFDLADGVYFLSAIHIEGSTTRNDIVRTKSESKKIALARSKRSVTVGP